MTEQIGSGRLFVLKMAATASATTYETVGSVKTTSVIFDKAEIDATSKDTAGGWQENIGGRRSGKISFDGIFKNSTSNKLLWTAYAADTAWNYEIEDQAGNTWAFAANLTSLEYSGDDGGVQQFKGSMSTTGIVVHTPVV
jgi:predicted secreted protein